jgi:hypothetical protein
MEIMIYGNYAMIAFHKWDKGIPTHNPGRENAFGVPDYIIEINLSGQVYIFTLDIKRYAASCKCGRANL